MWRRTGVLSVLVLTLTAGWVASQEGDEPKPSGRRLPNFYSKVGLRQTQREAIYDLQDRYADKIEELIRQVEELRKERDTAIEQVLNDDQRAELKKLIAEAAAKSQAKKAAAEAAKAAGTKPPAPEPKPETPPNP